MTVTTTQKDWHSPFNTHGISYPAFFTSFKKQPVQNSQYDDAELINTGESTVILFELLRSVTSKHA